MDKKNKISLYIKKIMLVLIVVIMVLTNASIAVVDKSVIKEKLINELEKYSDETEEITITTTDTTIVIDGIEINGQPYEIVINYDIDDKSTFYTDLKFDDTMDKEDFNNESIKTMMLFAMFSYISEIQGVDGNDAFSYILQKITLDNLTFNISDAENGLEMAKESFDKIVGVKITDELFNFYYQKLSETNKEYNIRAVLEINLNRDFEAVINNSDDPEKDEEEKQLFDLSVVNVGDYINYTAGTWTQSEIDELKQAGLYYGEELANSPYKFGSIKPGLSKDNCIEGDLNDEANYSGNRYLGSYNDEIYDGWRMLGRFEDGKIAIVSAGITETYYSPFGDNKSFITSYIFNGEKSEYDDTAVTNGYSVRNWKVYENDKYAVEGSAHCISSGEAYSITDSESASDNNLRNIGGHYITSTLHCEQDMWNVEADGSISKYADVITGIRPVITLKSTLKVSDAGEKNGVKVWNLVSVDDEEDQTTNDNENNKKDDSLFPGNLPKAGEFTIISILGVIIMVAIIEYIKFRKSKEIK